MLSKQNVIFNIQWCTKKPCVKNKSNQFIKIFNKKFKNHLYRNKRMLLCSSDVNQQTVNSELKKAYRKSGIQIANRNEKLCSMLNKANASQNSRQTIGNTLNSF